MGPLKLAFMAGQIDVLCVVRSRIPESDLVPAMRPGHRVKNPAFTVQVALPCSGKSPYRPNRADTDELRRLAGRDSTGEVTMWRIRVKLRAVGAVSRPRIGDG